MPIVDVQLVGNGSEAPEGLASRLAEALASVFSAPPGRVWVRLALLSKAQYAENGVNAAAASFPVFVRVLHADLPSVQLLATEAEATAHAVAECLECSSEQVHVEYAPAGRGRVAFGGRLLA